MSDFLRFVFPFAPETKERKLAREIVAKLKMEFVSDDQRKAVFASISDSSDSGYKDVGEIEYRTMSGKTKKATVYKINHFSSIPIGLIAVGIKDGEILYTKETEPNHGQIIRAVHPNKSVDEYVRFEFNKGEIVGGTLHAGIVADISDSTWEANAIDNINRALDKLNRAGIPETFKVKINRDSGKAIHTTVKSLEGYLS